MTKQYQIGFFYKLRGTQDSHKCVSVQVWVHDERMLICGWTIPLINHTHTKIFFSVCWLTLLYHTLQSVLLPWKLRGCFDICVSVGENVSPVTYVLAHLLSVWGPAPLVHTPHLSGSWRGRQEQTDLHTETSLEWLATVPAVNVWTGL